MTTIRIVFLGTSAAVPQKNRFLSGLALQREKGEILLFDCGEGTQYQIMKYKVNFQKISKIFLSHLHGDHLYGIFGLLSTMKLADRSNPLKIYGPPGTKQYLKRFYGEKIENGFSYPIGIFDTEEGFVCEDEDYQIVAKRTMHSIYTLAYAYIEKDRLGHFDTKKAQELKVKKGNKWQQLQKGKSVLSEDNKVILPEMVLGPKRRGFKIVIGSDGTYQEEDFVPFAMGADVLVLEATFSDINESKAKEKLHSTSRWSAIIARKAKVKKLFLTHISPRTEEEENLKNEAQEEFPSAVIAYDGLEIHLNRKDLESE